MGYKALVNDLVAQAVSAVGDLADTITFVKHTGGSYDPATGTPTETTVEYPGIQAVMPKFSAAEKDDKVMILTDRKCLIPAKSLATGVVPEENDEVRNSQGTWDVIRILGVPGESLFILHVRLKR